MKVLVVDNYDSFVYIIVHAIRSLANVTIDVVRNDQVDLEQVARYDKILLSPGPGIPDEAGCMKTLIQQYGPVKSILGICLGHQAIAEVYGARLYNMSTVLHGVTGTVVSHADDLFSNLPDTFQVGHYHSWAVEAASVNYPLRVTATDSLGQVMGIAHNEFDVKGLQFHPESVMTAHGLRILQNWLQATGEQKQLDKGFKQRL